MRRRAALAAAVAALVAGCGGGDDPPRTTDTRAQTPPPPGREVDAQMITTHLRALQRIADRSGGTRAAGTKGDTASADYIAEQLRLAGWTVRLQTVRFPFFAQRSAPVLDDLEEDEDFAVAEYSPGGDVTATVQPRDTQGCDTAALGEVPEGDVVLVARGVCTFRRKALNAQEAGAGALLVVDRERRRPVGATLVRPSGVRIPVMTITDEVAADLARKGTVHVKVDTVSEQRETRNVIAESPGTAADGDVVMAGAHLDSVEEGPGINDDGSGVAALLALAPRLAERQGVRFGFWAAEELGLYGSRHYVRGLTRDDRRRVRAYLNLDMVGSPKPRPLIYASSDRIERVLRDAWPGDESQIDLGDSSDHAPFQDAGIAIGGLFSGASEKTDPCYHRACDTIRNVDAPFAAKTAQAAGAALQALQP